MRRILAALALSIALAVGLAPGFAIAADGNLAVGQAGATQALTTQASSAPTVTVTRAATGKVAVEAGKSYKLGAKTTAGKLTYKSSKKTVATVSSKGVVKAKKAGKATITVTAKSGSKKTVKKVAVTVLTAKKYKEVKAVKAKASATSLEVGKTATVEVAFTPSKASNKNVTFKSSNAKVLTVDAAGKMTAVTPGTAKVTVTSCDNAKAKASVAIKVTNNTPTVSGVTVKAGLEKYTWTELKKIAIAISDADGYAAGLAIAKEYRLTNSSGELTGATKPLTLTDGTKTSVRILGFLSDSKSAGGKAGITFEFADSPTTHGMNSTETSEGGWKASEMRTWLNSDFYKLLPSDLQSGIVEVTKKTNNTGYVESESTSVVTKTEDKLWLLSLSEVYGKLTNPRSFDPVAIYDAEGTQYKLYYDQSVTDARSSFAGIRTPPRNKKSRP